MNEIEQPLTVTGIAVGVFIILIAFRNILLLS